MKDALGLPVHNPNNSAVTWLEGGRRAGMTTAMVDIAIMNARAGAKVQYWSRTWSEADSAANVCYHRLQVTDAAPADSKFFQPGGVKTLLFPNGGRVEFRGLDGTFAGDQERPGIDFSMYDANGTGKVVRHHADVRHR